MDRDRIERRDFPTGRRGYDPGAVDEHLRRVADEFDAQVRAPRPSLADSTSEQVRLILDAAERGAAELRTRAGEEATDHVARVHAAAGGMLSKLDELETELTRLLSALRTGGERLTEGLEQLQAEVAEGMSAASQSPPAAGVSPPPAARVAPPAARPAPAPAEGPSVAAAPGDDRSPADDVPPPPADDVSPPAAHVSPPAADVSPPPAADVSPPAAGRSAADADADDDGSGRNGSGPPQEESLFDAGPGLDPPAGEPDEAGARLIALNMALGGSTREETAAFLTERFGLADPDGLLDDVFARAGR